MKPLKSISIVVAWVSLGAASAFAREDAATEVVVLGVAHSAMLVAEPYRPAIFRAYIDDVEPDAICIERPPEEFARGSHYEFTYEMQGLAVPYARKNGISLCPFDWIPEAEDQILAFGIDLQNLPFVRGPRKYANFLTYPDPAALSRELFYAEAEAQREEYREWYQTVPEKPRFDFPRRLFLYRTFLQATWTGVLDRRRIDSFADPFGNLTVAQRAMLEEARELLKLERREAAASIREDLEAALSMMKAAQLRAYWSEWVEDAR